MDADSSLDHVFFPDSGVVSVVAVYADGSIIEMATIGREGCTGVQAIFGAKTSSVRLLVQIPGSAAKMSRAAFTRAMESMPSFRSLMYAYVQAFLEQVMVSVACNGAHSLKQRLARWLLMMRDRSDDDALQITQNLLAEMLGVQRPTITNAARELERAGLIERGRRQVTILDRQGLTEASCECYQLVRDARRFSPSQNIHSKKSSSPPIGNVHYRQHIPTEVQLATSRADGGVLWQDHILAVEDEPRHQKVRMSRPCAKLTLGIDPRRTGSGVGGWLVEGSPNSSADRSSGRAATREPSCV